MDQTYKRQKHKLVLAALRLFHEAGYGQTSFATVAKAAGFSRKEAEEYFSSREEICHKVIETHIENQAAQFENFASIANPRQRLSVYLDTLADNADDLVAHGCPMTNLYFDVKREDSDLPDHAAQLLFQRLDWISDQFVEIMRAENNGEFAERLTSALHGIIVMAQATGDPRLIRSQVIQLKAWIRSM